MVFKTKGSVFKKNKKVEAEMESKKMRQNMLEGQLTPNKITDKNVLNRMLAVPREIFVEHGSRNIAYMDNPVRMNQVREMFAPLVLARLLQEMNLEIGDKCLILASGSGYSAAVVSPLVSSVVVVEDDLSLLDICRRGSSDLNLRNITFVQSAPLKESHFGQFDKILIDTVVDEVPSFVFKELKEGGKLGCVVRDVSTGIVSSFIYTKEEGRVSASMLFETTGHVAQRFKSEERFVF